MNLTVTWNNPVPNPGCGYNLSYRRNGDASYTILSTSGSTSSTTSVSVYPSAPACYEGYVTSNCCAENLSQPDPWGVNRYSQIFTNVTIQVQPEHYILNITANYPNPYPTIISGSFISSVAGTIAYSQTFPANVVTAAIVLPQTPTGGAETITSTTITTLSPIFNNGGQLQQFDAVNTPPYFEYLATSGQTSGTTSWIGSPVVLPSFNLVAFNVTESDTSGNPSAGSLLVSWIQGLIYQNGVSPYNSITFDIVEAASPGTILGTASINPVNGLNNLSVSFVRGLQAINTSTEYKMTIYWNDGSQPAIGSSAVFYLPNFSI